MPDKLDVTDAPTEPAPMPEAASVPEDATKRAMRSMGAQVVLDPASPAAIAARGGAADTMEGNAEAHAQAMVARAGEAVPVSTVTTMRDPVGDPESDAMLKTRGVDPSAPLVDPTVKSSA